jgi:hypothetical protein
MDAYDRCTNLGRKNLADSVANYGRGRELFRPPCYLTRVTETFHFIHSNVLSHPNYYATLDTTPPEGIPTLTQEWALRWSNNPDSYADVSIRPPMPDRPKVITQTKKDTSVLQIGAWAWCCYPNP